MKTAPVPIHGQIERVLPLCGRCLPLGTLKRCQGGRHLRHRDLPGEGTHLRLLCNAMNPRRAERPTPERRGASAA